MRRVPNGPIDGLNRVRPISEHYTNSRSDKPMPFIKLTDNASLEIVSTGSPAHLESGLEFLFRNLKPEFKEVQDKTIGELDAGDFPLALSASIPGSFAVSAATLNVKGGEAASLDLLTREKLQGFLKSLKLENSFAPGLISFAFTTTLEGGPSGTVGDFSFGLTYGQEISVAGYVPAATTDRLIDATQKAISGVTLPHAIDDLRSLPEGHVCRIKGKGSLKFQASVQYSIFTNTLATAPLTAISNTLSVTAQSGPMFQVTVEHTDTHQLTIAALGNNKVRLSVSLAAESGVEESLDVSIGVSANIGTRDALPFLIEHLSPSPEKELQELRASFSPGEETELSDKIKTVFEGAMKGGITATLHDALKQSKERNYLFVYEADLSALDATSTAALAAALKGDFTAITATGPVLAGIREVDSISTLTLTATHTLTIHLLGILNFSDVSSFVKKSKIGLSSDTGDVVLTASDIKFSENSIDPDHLREVLARSSVITTAALSSPQIPDFTFKTVFFLRKANVSSSDLRQFSNVLKSVSSPDGAQAQALLSGPASSVHDVGIYLSLDLDKGRSLSIFKNRTDDDFVMAGQNAMKTILSGDPDSADRLPLFSLDLDFWRTLREDGGTRQNVATLLETKGIVNQASPTDFFSIDWWAQAMGKVADALANGQPLMDAEKSALADSNGGFDVPWALLAARLLAGSPPVASHFTYSSAKTLAAKS